MNDVIWWLRRDLRLNDNPALQQALARGQGLVPVFILDDDLIRNAAPVRLDFLYAGLHDLDARLRRLGSRLIVRRGPAETVLVQLVQQTGATAIFAGADYSPYARRRDERVKREGLPLVLVEPGVTARSPESVLTANGRPYTVFTPYSRAWRAVPLDAALSPAPRALPPVPSLESLSLPEPGRPPLFPAGEAEALRRLDGFLSGPMYAYAEERDRLDREATAFLSPYFRFGMLSAAAAIQACMNLEAAAQDERHRNGCATWIKELIWREFYFMILHYHQEVLRQAFNPELEQIPWRSAPQDLAAWQQGRTGYPVVDAAMRQLLHTGWMHNRGRMITASFLVKDLLIDWQAGERWFMQHLVDGDPAANNGGWQWTAGTGTDAAPYFRVFNPVLQGERYDPTGDYVRRWVPELSGIPDAYIHKPWQMPPSVLHSSGVRLGVDYPEPIVDHARARDRALEAYAYARSLARGKG
ncbi:MAG: deoxyribodipyrimidine photo-lyase [Anaerolineaceae bacterium]|nr:deoxyribodipyrimidine photo-lyase [Anaerolineaceae bacterium]